uniref:Transmembrane channel-like protein 7-like n=1 Tax=Saccoglossus kowalevskii TaxID=10224 RepID=A0ABM0MGG8_SACKO|nr:PREDICTED: transmembrane channel-like protein 7-like [Saccoglossus kowalevskii]
MAQNYPMSTYGGNGHGVTGQDSTGHRAQQQSGETTSARNSFFSQLPSRQSSGGLGSYSSSTKRSTKKKMAHRRTSTRRMSGLDIEMQKIDPDADLSEIHEQRAKQLREMPAPLGKKRELRAQFEVATQKTLSGCTQCKYSMGFMELTELFYGFYYSDDLILEIEGEKIKYNMPLAYLLVCVAYFSLSLVLMTDLEEERRALRRAGRTGCQKFGLYTSRFIINIIVIIILAGSGYLIYYTTDFALQNKNNPVTDNEMLLFLISYLPSITITALNIVVPMIFVALIRFEDYSPEFEVQFTLFRTVFLRLASLAVLIASIYPQIVCDSEDQDTCGVCQPSNLQCWETYVGQELYKLAITDFFVVGGTILFVEFPRKFLVTKCICGVTKAIGQQEFEITKNVLDIIYSQTICWLGAFFSPLLPAICVMKSFIFFYLKKWSLIYNFLPPSRPYRASKSNTFFMVVLLIAFLLCLLPIGFSIMQIEPSRACGPFRNQTTMWTTVTNNVATWPQWMQDIINFIFSAGFAVPFLVILCLALYYYHSIASAHREMVIRLKEQLVMEGRDKHFLLARLQELDPQHGKGHKKKADRPPPDQPGTAWGGEMTPTSPGMAHPNVPLINDERF